jgi:hypothetical protein
MTAVERKNDRTNNMSGGAASCCCGSVSIEMLNGGITRLTFFGMLEDGRQIANSCAEKALK